MEPPRQRASMERSVLGRLTAEFTRLPSSDHDPPLARFALIPAARRDRLVASNEDGLTPSDGCGKVSSCGTSRSVPWVPMVATVGKGYHGCHDGGTISTNLRRTEFSSSRMPRGKEGTVWMESDLPTDPRRHNWIRQGSSPPLSAELTFTIGSMATAQEWMPWQDTRYEACDTDVCREWVP